MKSKAITSYYISRDLSWLKFDERVLMQAKDAGIPLLERLKFLSIYYSNLDEFFMVRVGSLLHRAAYLPGYKDEKTGRTSEEELKKILQLVSDQNKLAESVYSQLVDTFKASGIQLVDFKHLSKQEEIYTKKTFC